MRLDAIGRYKKEEKLWSIEFVVPEFIPLEGKIECWRNDSTYLDCVWVGQKEPPPTIKSSQIWIRKTKTMTYTNPVDGAVTVWTVSWEEA